MSRATIPSMAVAIGLLALCGCQKVPINANDGTPPTVELKIKGDNGQYAPASTAKMVAKTGQIDISCVVKDPDGVKSVSLSFVGGSDSCTTDGGAVYSGSYSTDGLPAPLTQTISGDASGKVLTTLPLLATLKGPLTCTVLGAPSQKGTPYDSKVLVQCAGGNWSSNSQVSGAVKTLEVSLK